MIFDFHLLPVGEIQPWVKPSDGSKFLSWFGLTDGFYRIKVGDEFLLNYTDKFIESLAKTYPHVKRTLINYQVARLWEDVWSILPHALHPLPDGLIEFLLSQNLSFLSWRRIAENWLRQREKLSSEVWESNVFNESTEWLSRRRLDVSYLRHRPSIWMWSHNDTVNLSWDTEDVEECDKRAWSAQNGIFSIPRSSFLEEIHRFNTDLLTQMEKRIAAICMNWDHPNIFIDLAALKEEQIQRSKSLQAALETPLPVIDWKSITESMRIIQG